MVPVSVIVAVEKGSMARFEMTFLPYIRENDPAEILLDEDSESAVEKWNIGASRATQPYIVFLDDSIKLYEFALLDLLRCLEVDKASFAYSDHRVVVHDGREERHRTVRASQWDAEVLRESNFIGPLALIRRTAFSGFDLLAGNFASWDLWLTMVGKGLEGIHVPRVLYEKHVADGTAIFPQGAFVAVRAKHGIITP